MGFLAPGLRKGSGLRSYTHLWENAIVTALRPETERQPADRSIEIFLWGSDGLVGFHPGGAVHFGAWIDELQSQSPLRPGDIVGVTEIPAVLRSSTHWQAWLIVKMFLRSSAMGCGQRPTVIASNKFFGGETAPSDFVPAGPSISGPDQVGTRPEAGTTRSLPLLAQERGNIEILSTEDRRVRALEAPFRSTIEAQLSLR